jgi:hypothetical protein
MKHIKTFSAVALTGIGAILAGSLNGCQQKTTEETQPQAKGAFVVIEETLPGRYKIKDEFPADETRIILKKLDGTEKVLTKEEMDKLLAEEKAKIDAGTSPLVAPDGEEVIQQQGGLSLGEAILASAAGAIIGSWIGSKLFNNPNYQNTRKAGYKSPSTYQRSKNSFNKPRKSLSTKRSGFFGGKKSSGYRSRGFFGG